MTGIEDFETCRYNMHQMTSIRQVVGKRRGLDELEVHPPTSPSTFLSSHSSVGFLCTENYGKGLDHMTGRVTEPLVSETITDLSHSV